jgi:hypothetical protein
VDWLAALHLDKANSKEQTTMTISMKKARDFIYSNGTLWERALFAYLFQAGSLERVHQCLLCYRNDDGGWGHALEHDIRTPDSHPLALEYLLSVLRDTGLPPGSLLDGAAAWVEANRKDDGSLINPPSVLDYPHAPWWELGEVTAEGGQTAPDSITGNLYKHGKATQSLLESTRLWVGSNLTLEKVQTNDWLFLAYHAFDYFMNVDDFPDLDVYRQATIDNIINCARNAPEKQYYVLFQFAPSPDSPISRAMPPDVLNRNLDYLLSSQRDDGGWNDENGLAQWQPYATILVLLALQRYGRLTIPAS